MVESIINTSCLDALNFYIMLIFIFISTFSLEKRLYIVFLSFSLFFISFFFFFLKSLYLIFLFSFSTRSCVFLSFYFLEETVTYVSVFLAFLNSFSFFRGNIDCTKWILIKKIIIILIYHHMMRCDVMHRNMNAFFYIAEM